MPLDPLHHTIIATDVEKSSSRTDDLLLRMRRDLRQMLADTLARQHVDIKEVPLLDDGDGFRILLPPTYSPHAALDPFITPLLVELRAHREASSLANRMRLRIAVHSGLLFRDDGGGYTGTPLKDCARLLDADAGRALLADNPAADLVLLVSDTVYHDVVRSGRSLDPAAFRQVQVKVKETDRRAWAYLPATSGAAPDPATPAPPAQTRPTAPAPTAPAPTASAARGGSTAPASAHAVNIHGDGHVFHGPIIGGHSYG